MREPRTVRGPRVDIQRIGKGELLRVTPIAFAPIPFILDARGLCAVCASETARTRMSHGAKEKPLYIPRVIVSRDHFTVARSYAAETRTRSFSRLESFSLHARNSRVRSIAGLTVYLRSLQSESLIERRALRRIVNASDVSSRR